MEGSSGFAWSSNSKLCCLSFGSARGGGSESMPTCFKYRFIPAVSFRAAIGESSPPQL